MNCHDEIEDQRHRPARDDSGPRRVEVVLPRARSIVWLGLKVYLIVTLGLPLAAMAVVLVLVALVAAIGALI